MISIPSASAASRCTVAQFQATPLMCVGNDPAVQNAKDRVAGAQQTVADEAAAAEAAATGAVGTATDTVNGAAATANAAASAAVAQASGAAGSAGRIATNVVGQVTSDPLGVAGGFDCSRLAGHHLSGSSRDTAELVLHTVGVDGADGTLDAFYSDANNLDQVCARDI